MNLTIRTKLITGFVIMLSLLLVCALLATSKLNELSDRMSFVIDVSAKRIDLSNEILKEIMKVSRFEKNIIYEREPIGKNFAKERLERSLVAIDEKVSELSELTDDRGRQILEEFIASWKNYRATLDEILALSLSGENADALQLSLNEGRQMVDEAEFILERLVQKNQKDMTTDKTNSEESYRSSLNLIIALIILGVIISTLITYWIVRGIGSRIAFIANEAEKISSREYSQVDLNDSTEDELRPVFNSLVNINESFRDVTQNANSVALGNYDVDIVPKSEKDLLGVALKKMTDSLRKTTAENRKHNWLATGQNQFNEVLRGDKKVKELASDAVTFLSNYVGANIGAVYLFNDDQNALILEGGYAMSVVQEVQKKFVWGEGLIGQAAVEQESISVPDVDERQIRVTSSILNAKPAHLIITPFHFEGKTLGVVELGKLVPFTDVEKEFIDSVMEALAISINSAVARKRIQQLLEETQVQSEELQAQQEELKQANEELEEQARSLKQQQEELQVTNEELEEQAQSLELKNKELVTARQDIERKSSQLELSSRYKSEFLANMSHELRTPLNSMLILSRDLADNKEKNLTHEQVESAEIINKSGYHLLELINEVLDLSKIEAGKMTLNIERLSLKEFFSDLIQHFKRQAEEKGLKVNLDMEKSLPEAIRTDARRLDQIVKNLVSNAIKFTEKGEVSVSIKKQGIGKLAIAVADTGIGIAREKLSVIFEAFRQEDGSTSRRYGGTGLGLSISRELARLLGGEITVVSKANEGSTFTLVIPLDAPSRETETQKPQPDISQDQIFDERYINYLTIEDDRKSIQPDDKVLLIIEDDLKFAEIFLKQAHRKGFKCLAAATGEDGLLMADQYKPHAIILDLDLPGIDGRKVLAELKANPTIRHIPVHIVSVSERTIEPIKEGALEYLTKPVDKKQLEQAFNRIENFISRKMKNLLIIEDDEDSRKAMKKLIGNGDVKCFEAKSGTEALAVFQDNHIDCIVLDLGLPDTNGFELIYQLKKAKGWQTPPIIIYTGKELTKEEDAELQKYAETIIIKGVKSEERLLDETALFLHRTISNLPESKQRIIAGLYDKEKIFANKKILVVDDDMRNVFALSKVLKEHGMNVLRAENGLVALQILKQYADIALILMDIMMPVLDGYETMRKIRSQEQFKKLPVIALTAKAMKDDKQKCIDAGANDYIAKPLDVNRLLSLMRVWLSI